MKLNKKFVIFGFCLIALFICGGCDADKNSAVLDKEKNIEEVPFKKISDTNLARVLLDFKVKEISISKDPFAPIVWDKLPRLAGKNKQIDTVGDIIFVGVMKINNQYYALLETYSATGIFKKNDMIRNFKVEDIFVDHIVLQEGDKKYTIKRGEKNETQ